MSALQLPVTLLVAAAAGLLARRLAIPGGLLTVTRGTVARLGTAFVEQGTGAVEVATFHLVRIVLVILSLPLLVHLLRAGSG